MWRDDDACLTKPGSARCSTRPVWLALGPDRALLDQHVQALARFGVTAEAAPSTEPLPLPSPITPLLCDGRARTLVSSLLDAMPARAAPLLVFGINAAQERARLIRAGVDDVVAARISPCELAARMFSVQRSRAAAQGIVALAGFNFDTGLRQVCWRGQALALMPREFDLLLVLARHAGMAVSRDMLLHTVWRTTFDPGTNSPEVHIFKLRQRLAALGGAVQIETVKRQGYRLVSDPSSQG